MDFFANPGKLVRPFVGKPAIDLRECGDLEVLSEEDIWEYARRLWEKLRNHKVGSAYVQAYRIADKVIKAKGDNTFLGIGGNIHTGVTQDFEPTPNGGLARKDKDYVPILL